MTRRPYALEPLLRVRERKVDESSRALVDATTAHAAAEHGRQAAEMRLRRSDEGARAIRHAEQASLERSQSTVADLARAAEWGVCAEIERATQVRRVSAAEEAVREAREREEQSRTDLALRRTDAKVIEKHRETWAIGVRKAEESREEEQAEEAWRPAKRVEPQL